jgi:hypothetical protein
MGLRLTVDQELLATATRTEQLLPLLATGANVTPVGDGPSASSAYLLTGLVVRTGCRRHFTGTRATGRNAPYPSHT